MKKYNQVVCGGTFDLLHKGHKKFLQDILNLSGEVLVGITSNEYVSKFKQEGIEDFEIRKKLVLDFLASLGVSDRVEIVSINQAYEPLLTSKFSPRAIAVTLQTKKTAIEINDKRKKLGLPELIIEVIEMERAEDGEEISSSRIRNGEINREGRLFLRDDWRNRTLKLPISLRSELQKPFGKVLNSAPSGLDGNKIITVGDVTTKLFNEKGVKHFLSIVDFRVKREKKFNRLEDLGFDKDVKKVEVINLHSTITPQLLDAVVQAIKSSERCVILIDGEDDLAVIPCLLLAPLGYLIFYGQADQGLVEISVTEENKEKAFYLASKFASN